MKLPVHYLEINSISDDIERIELLELLNTYGKSVKIDSRLTKQRIDVLISSGFGIADAAHVAFSEQYNAVFITCDDKLLTKCSRHIESIECFNPIAFCELEKLK